MFSFVWKFFHLRLVSLTNIILLIQIICFLVHIFSLPFIATFILGYQSQLISYEFLIKKGLEKERHLNNQEKLD